MSTKTSQAPAEVRNGVDSFGLEQQWQMQMDTNVVGAGSYHIHGPKNDISGFKGKMGGGLSIISQTDSSFGNNSTLPNNHRGTKNSDTQTGNGSKPTITSLANPDGTGMTLDSGAGRSPTMHMSTSDGLCSMTMTSANGGAIILRVGQTELVVNGAKGQVEVTKQVVQEKIDHKAELEKYRKNMNDSLRNAMKPYSDACGDCDGSGQQSGSSCESCTGTGVSGSSGSSGGSGRTTGSDFTGSSTSGVG
jgi:hypothetical protein